MALIVAAALGAALACSAGSDAAALHAVPLLVLALPLLGGRYVGERRLHALAARVGDRRAAPRRATALRVPAARGPRVPVARGGELVARALAERGPPALAA